MSNTSTPASLDITAQAIRALTLYSLAEFQSGHASTIRVSAEGTSFAVADDGRGHAIDRAVAGSPYLQFIYTHLDYPFAAVESGPVQLHGIGMSLLNVLCSDLAVTVHKANETLRMTYQAGQLRDEKHFRISTESSGNIVSGTISPLLQRTHANTARIEQWLLGVLAANPRLKLHFNGNELHAPQPGAA